MKSTGAFSDLSPRPNLRSLIGRALELSYCADTQKLGNWTPTCWVSMGLACTENLSGHPSWTSDGLRDQASPEKGPRGESRLKESTLRVRHCKGVLSGRPHPKSPKARSSVSAHKASHPGSGDH